jgi:hypothetical protein
MMNEPVTSKTNHTFREPGADWLVLTRMVIFLVTIMVLIFYYAHLPAYYQFLVSPSGLIVTDLNWGPTQLQSAVEQAGQSITTLALISTSLFGILTAVYAGVALLLLLRKPQDPVAAITAFTLVLFGTGFPPILNVVSTIRPELERILFLWGEGGFTVLFILFLIFPDGRFRPRWTALLAAFWGIQPFIVTFWPESPFLVYTLPQPWGSVAPLTILGLFAVALIYRYFVLFNPVQRQQTKWAVAGMSFTLIIFLIFLANYYSHPELKASTPEAAVQSLLGISALTLIFTIIPVTLGIAITRHRLWEIDLIIRRTISYSLVTATLLIVYFGVVILLQVFSERILNLQNSQISTVISTLTIAALFNPLRKRVQLGIDKRFNRRKLDTLEAISSFSARMQSEVELDAIKADIQHLIQESIQPSQVAIWIKTESQLPNFTGYRNDTETPSV